MGKIHGIYQFPVEVRVYCDEKTGLSWFENALQYTINLCHTRIKPAQRLGLSYSLKDIVYHR